MKKLQLISAISCAIASGFAHSNQCDTSHCGDRFDLESSSCKAAAIKNCQNLAQGDDITIKVNSNKDFVYISANNHPKARVHSHQFNKEINISHLFANGNNDLRIESFAQSSNFGFDAKIYKNGTEIKSINCYKNNCNDNGSAEHHKSNHLYYDGIHNIPYSGAGKKDVSIRFSGLSSGWSGNIYINNKFTGKLVENNPTLSLPPGEYTIAVGLNKEEDIAYGTHSGTQKYLRNYDGKYYEKKVVVSNNNQTVDFSGVQQSTFKSAVRIGIVPIREFDYTLIKEFPDGSRQTMDTVTYQLTQEDIDRFEAQANATAKRYIEPLSYGLQTWDIDVLDVYEDSVSDSDVVKADANGDLIGNKTGDINGGTFFKNTLNGMYDDHYDVLIAYYPKDFHSGAAASSGYIHIASVSVNGTNEATPSESHLKNITLPNELLLHEVLHVYEQWHQDKTNEWKGVAGMHGGQIYGWTQRDANNFSEDERLWESPDWMRFNANIFRGTLVETNSMSDHKDDPRPSTPPSTGDRYVGLFDTVINGLGNLHKPNNTQPVTITNRLYQGAELSHNHGDMIFSHSDELGQKGWLIQPESNYVRFENTWFDDEYLRTNNSNWHQLMASTILPGWHSARWYLEGVNPHDNAFYLKLFWTGQYLTQTNNNSVSVEQNAQLTSPYASEWVVERNCEISANLIPNCSFEDNNATNWQYLNHNGAWGWASWGDTDNNDDKGNKEVKLNVGNPGSEHWNSQLRTSFAIPAQGAYALKFKAKTENMRIINANIGDTGPNWTSYYNTGEIILTSKWQNYSFYIPNLPADGNAYLDFNVGKFSSEDVYIDNVILEPAN